jgi:hypothetical protein
VKKIILIFIVCFSLLFIHWLTRHWHYYYTWIHPQPQVGDVIDRWQGVPVYYNGEIDHTSERHLSADGYNLGLKYQCVEFVKRFYFQYYQHRMPDSYGHAKDFFDSTLADASYNPKRNLLQFKHPSINPPQVNDLIIFDGHEHNPYGHVAIISAVANDHIEIIQQNAGSNGHSRAIYQLELNNHHWQLNEPRILGWLRIENH